ncbi:MAG: PepSY-like domain-containing protein [Prevotellaceae bacterium]|jgi:hypothetical protein|nr:PepSY-like domain-containing protein [Prevotellaceae bacterium]
MKRVFRLLLASSLALVAFGYSAQCAAKNDVALPSAAKEFVAANFADANVKSVVQQASSDQKYTATLGDGTVIIFLTSGEWDVVENQVEVTTSFILAPIREYVRHRYGRKKITRISHESYGYAVRLSAGMEGQEVDLRFDGKGVFLPQQ